MADKQKLCFFINGKRFGYEGYPANRQRDLLDFIVKRKTPEDQWVAVFRENQEPTDAALSDADVAGLVRKAVEARERKKAAKAPKDDDEPGVPAPAGEQTPQLPTQPPPEVTQQQLEYAAYQQQYQQQQAEAAAAAAYYQQQQAYQQAPPTTRGTAQFSEGERESLKGFINQILTESDEAPTRGSGVGYEAPSAHAPSPAGAASAARSSAGKLTVYLETKDAAANKIMSVPTSISYAEFEAAVQKKFGVKMEMVFKNEDDRIILDDDDSLEMFLSLDVKKHKLACSPYGAAGAAVTDDKLTSIAGSSSTTGHGGGAGAELSKALANAQDFHREERTYPGHAAAVYCCSFSPSGDRFATASRDKTVRVWTMDGDHRQMQGGHSGFVLSCDFSPNGLYIVSSSDDTTLKIWDARTGEKRHTLKGHSDKVYCAKFNATGAYVVSGSCDRTVRVWNADNGSRQATLKGHTMAVFSCGFSRTDNGKHVVSASDDRSVKLWDWREGKEIRSFEGHTGTVWSCEFSHSDRLIVSASMDHEIKLWSVATGEAIRNFPGHMTPIHHAIFTSDDRFILSCARDWTVMVWEVESGKHVDTLSGHVNTVYHLDIHGDKLLTCSLDETVKLWKLALPKSDA
jgi:WD40 repeat protein